MTELQVISQHDAYCRGFSRFFTGKPCRRGHVAERCVHSYSCVECKQMNKSKRNEKVFAREKFGRDIREPERSQWRDDGGARVEVVTDPNWLIDGKPRVVRRVGWRACVCCERRFFSLDLAKNRICECCHKYRTGGIDDARLSLRT